MVVHEGATDAERGVVLRSKDLGQLLTRATGVTDQTSGPDVKRLAADIFDCSNRLNAALELLEDEYADS